MWEPLNEKLEQANAKRQEKLMWERRLADIQRRIRELKNRLPALEVVLDRENRDVEKLTAMTLTRLFHTLLRSREEQLELERRQAVEAALKLQEARRLLADLELERREAGEALALVREAELEYDSLLREKEEKLRALSPETATRLKELDDAAAEAAANGRELREAVDEGERALLLLKEAEASLGKAEGWGQWDMLGGGAIATHLKHGHIDDARDAVRRAQLRLTRFEKELADLGRHSPIRIDIGGTLQFADYFLDGLIADWIVQGRIEQSMGRVRNVRHRVESLLSTLRKELADAESELGRLRARRSALIEKA
ncbi:hypothetical protein [Paenibacillus flagellatus]|uniref:hypothetical protein n=1 Tax=Paenibacillus flagellatus TaxID=2211139 RepID=UPI0011B6F4A7|nr:hypothetical protein [Paenibacillus flagellatus]